jgi:nitroreductase
MEFQSTVLKRRTVRNFLRDPVPDEVVHKLIELAQHAPSAGFSQGVEYLVIKDPENKKKIGGEQEITPAGFHNFISYAPVLIIILVSEAIYHRRYQEPDKIQKDGTEITWATPYWFFDAGATVMIMLLAAIDMGYAAAFTGVHTIDFSKLRQLLNIPEEYHPVGLISLGRPAPDKKSPSLKRGRRKFEDVAHFEKW